MPARDSASAHSNRGVPVRACETRVYDDLVDTFTKAPLKPFVVCSVAVSFSSDFRGRHRHGLSVPVGGCSRPRTCGAIVRVSIDRSIRGICG